MPEKMSEEDLILEQLRGCLQVNGFDRDGVTLTDMRVSETHANIYRVTFKTEQYGLSFGSLWGSFEFLSAVIPKVKEALVEAIGEED